MPEYERAKIQPQYGRGGICNSCTYQDRIAVMFDAIDPCYLTYDPSTEEPDLERVLINGREVDICTKRPLRLRLNGTQDSAMVETM